MEKIRPHGKNEMFNEYFAVVKEKLDEIVDFLGRIYSDPNDTMFGEIDPPEDDTPEGAVGVLKITPRKKDVDAD